MRNDSRIPVVAGVTGHRDIRDEDREKLRISVRGELDAIRTKCPHSPLVVMTGLAEGADQLCAEVALEMGLEIISVLPMPMTDYAADFNGAAFEKLMRLYDASSEVVVSPKLEAYDERFGQVRDWRYRQAGLYIAKHSHVLLALWDGTEGDECGCGTASIAAAMLNGTFGQSRSRQLHPDDRTVIQVITPRAGKGGAEDMSAGGVIRHGGEAVLGKMLRDTERFNCDCGALPDTPASSEAIKSADTADKVRARLRKMYGAADAMSVDNAVKHTKYLARLSVAAVTLAMAFLLYDEADWYSMILVCGIMIIVLFGINAFGKRSKYQTRYLEYRVLAEMLRVQYHLRSAGVTCEVSEIMPWNLQLSMPWVRSAVSAAMIGKEPSGRSRIRENWVIGQRDYHEKALIRSVKKLRSNDRIIRAALIMTLVIYAFALLFEIGFCGLFGGRNIFSAEVNETIRMYIKIAMGTAAAGTLFASNYYGKQALPNVIEDHRKMQALYEEAADEIDRLGENEDLLIRLAEDELNENANWYAYQSKSEPDLGI